MLYNEVPCDIMNEYAVYLCGVVKCVDQRCGVNLSVWGKVKVYVIIRYGMWS